MASTVNPYTVQSHRENEEAHEEEECQQLPGLFDNMPREVQLLVLKRTGARFVVTHRARIDPVQLLLPHTFFWPHAVPVIVHYELRLLPRRASGPEMIARFTLNLDAACQQLPEWRYMHTTHQALFLNGVAWLAKEFEPFSQLKYTNCAGDETHKLFCFLSTGRQEVAPPWSKFDDQMLIEVREKMQTVFGLSLQDLQDE
jgi:hypothetical protein